MDSIDHIIIELLTKVDYLSVKNDFIFNPKINDSCKFNKNQKILDQNMKNKNTIFSLIEEKSDTIIEILNNEPVCKYDKLFIWRELSLYLGQDIFTCSYYVTKDIKLKKFDWPPIIKNNNNRVNNILKSGVAENHFHLKGSSQIFTLNWINLMNNPFNREKEVNLLKQNGVDTKSFCKEIYNASAIRVYLFNKYVALNDCIGFNIFNFDERNCNEIENEISIASYDYGNIDRGYVIDYAIPKNNMLCEKNILLIGERRIIYYVLSSIFSDTTNNDAFLFYKYLLIKNKIRSIFIQNNGINGFGNFSNFESRKNIFLDKNSYFMKKLNLMSLCDTSINQHIESFEARFSPKKKSFELNVKIKQFSRILLENGLEVNKYCFTLHIPKFRDKFDANLFIVPVRNNNTRKDLLTYLYSIKTFFRQYENSKYILGLDACNDEVDCRPEVFGCFYRYFLSNNIVNHNGEITSLMGTYHVGEDFYDLIDGVRAIDEALKFLGYKRGCRFGHALALGMDSELYYDNSNYLISMSKQNLIDNFVWLIHFSKCNNISITNNFEHYLKNIANNLFIELFGNDYKFDDSLYYQSMLLRGDSPKIYSENFDYFKKEIYKNYYILDYEQYYINDQIDNCYRTNEEVFYLVKSYFYKKNTRIVGSEFVEVEIEHKYRNEYISIVKNIQQILCKDIVSRGICIETNPSSNMLIQTMDKYINHPIFRFNNRYLEGIDSDFDQINISINTDDQGVFETSIENEYALVALALEKKIIHNGGNVEDIYLWLDYVRKLGIEQSFSTL